MKWSRLRRDEDSLCRRIYKSEGSGTRVSHATYTVRLKLQTTASRRSQGRESEHYLRFSLTFYLPPFPCGALLLFFFPSAVLHPPPPISSLLPPSLGCDWSSLPPLFSLSIYLAIERERKKEMSAYTRTRNKKMIGSRYKGKFLRGSLNGNSNFSMLVTNRSLSQSKRIMTSLLFYYRINRFSPLSRLSLNIFSRQVINPRK